MLQLKLVDSLRSMPPFPHIDLIMIASNSIVFQFSLGKYSISISSAKHALRKKYARSWSIGFSRCSYLSSLLLSSYAFKRNNHLPYLNNLLLMCLALLQEMDLAFRCKEMSLLTSHFMVSSVCNLNSTLLHRFFSKWYNGLFSLQWRFDYISVS